jgi:hypothetical protein
MIRCLASKKKTSINFWHLLLGDVQLGTLEIKTEWYNSLIQKEMWKGRILKKDNGESTTNEKRLCHFAYRIISKALNLIPTDMSVENLKFKLDDNGKKNYRY